MLTALDVYIFCLETVNKPVLIDVQNPGMMLCTNWKTKRSTSKHFIKLKHDKSGIKSIHPNGHRSLKNV